MLQNDYLVAKIGVDTAENEPYVKSDVTRAMDPWSCHLLLFFCMHVRREESWERRGFGAAWTPRAPRPLVEKFDTELFSDFSAKSSNFRRLVLGCINADFCVQILILQRFSRSTRFSHLCTARNSKSSQIFVKLFHIFAEIYVKIAIFQQFSSNFAQISMRISQNFDE